VQIHYTQCIRHFKEGRNNDPWLIILIAANKKKIIIEKYKETVIWEVKGKWDKEHSTSQCTGGGFSAAYREWCV